MGVQGLRKFIDGSSCSRAAAPAVTGGTSTPVEPAALVDHLLFDMNGVIHQCYSREHTSPRDTIVAVLERMERILKEVVTPRLTLVLAVDGPPQAAKLATQRQRRRKVKHMDVQNGNNFSDLSITVGSAFLVELEQCLVRFLAAARAEGWLRCRRATVVGSSVIGEGEHKIAKALHLISRDPALYLPESPVVIVGNDIDLVLTCMGATPFVNLAVLSPNTLQVVDVGVILKRWTDGEGAFVKNMTELATARLDFIFIFLINGGDHFVGLGDAAASLWRRYKLLRSANPKFRLFNASATKIEVPNFAELIGCDMTKPIDDDGEDDYGGDPDEINDRRAPKTKKAERSSDQPQTRMQELLEVSKEFLLAMMSAFAATVRGEVADYRDTPPDTSLVSIATLRDAVLRLPSAFLTFRRHGEQPLTPLQSYAAVMPTKDTLPGAVQAAAIKYPSLAAALDAAREPKEVISAVLNLWKKVDIEALTPVEKFLTQFGDPVDVTFADMAAPPKSLAAVWRTPLLPGKGKEAVMPFDRETPMLFGDIFAKKANFVLAPRPAVPAAAAPTHHAPHHRHASAHGRVDRRGQGRGKREMREHDDMQQRVLREFSRKP